jgi:MFS family permease
LNGIVQGGASVGTFLIFTLAGYVADNLGWEAVFYVTGACTLVWVVLWFYLAYDTPGQHPRIDKEEREYIETSLGDADIDR